MVGPYAGDFSTVNPIWEGWPCYLYLALRNGMIGEKTGGAPMRWSTYLVTAALMISTLILLPACSENPSNHTATELPDAISHPAAVAYGPQNGKKEEDYQFGFSWGGVADYCEPMPAMFERACDELGIPTPIDGTPENWLQEEQNLCLDELLRQGVSGICMMPSEELGGSIKIARLVEQGIPVVCIGGQPTQPSMNTLTLATDAYQCAYDAALTVLDALDYEGNIVALTGATTDTNSAKRLQGIADACAQYGNVTLLDQISGISSVETGLQLAGEMLERYGNQIDGVVAMDYYAAYAMAYYLLEEPAYGHIVCVGMDSDDLVLEAISQGKMMGSMSQNPWAQAYLAVYTLKMLQDGWSYREGQPSMVDTGSFLITKEHVDDYETIAIDLTMALAETWTDRFCPPPSEVRHGEEGGL